MKILKKMKISIHFFFILSQRKKFFPVLFHFFLFLIIMKGKSVSERYIIRSIVLNH